MVFFSSHCCFRCCLKHFCLNKWQRQWYHIANNSINTLLQVDIIFLGKMSVELQIERRALVFNYIWELCDIDSVGWGKRSFFFKKKIVSCHASAYKSKCRASHIRILAISTSIRTTTTTEKKNITQNVYDASMIGGFRMSNQIKSKISRRYTQFNRCTRNAN